MQNQSGQPFFFKSSRSRDWFLLQHCHRNHPKFVDWPAVSVLRGSQTSQTQCLHGYINHTRSPQPSCVFSKWFHRTPEAQEILPTFPAIQQLPHTVQQNFKFAQKSFQIDEACPSSDILQDYGFISLIHCQSRKIKKSSLLQVTVVV